MQSRIYGHCLAIPRTHYVATQTSSLSPRDREALMTSHFEKKKVKEYIPNKIMPYSDPCH